MKEKSEEVERQETGKKGERQRLIDGATEREGEDE